MKHHDLPERDEAIENCCSLGVIPPEDFYGRLCVFLDLLSDCSMRMNLVGPVERGRLWRRHVLESVSYAAYLARTPVVDIGTGAGFPGFILSLLGYSVTMVEPREKRAGFLRTAARECGIKGKVLCGRIERCGPFPEGIQYTSRAVKKPEEMIPLIQHASDGGFSLLIRVPDRRMTLEGSCCLHHLQVPPLDREGFLLQYSHSCIHE